MDQLDNVYGGHSSYFYSPYNYPTAPVIAQHNQQSTSVEATGNSFAGELRHGRDTSGGHNQLAQTKRLSIKPKV